MKTQKLVFKLFLMSLVTSGLVGLLTLVGCTKNSTVQKTSVRVPKIGFVLATMNEERYVKDKTYFIEAAKNMGVEVEFAACDNKVDIQTSKVETLLSKKIDALVVQPVNADAASSLVQMAKKDGVPVVAYDRLIKNGDIDAYVTQDSFQVGVLQAEAAVAAAKGKGNFVILMGEAGHSVADEITRGNLSVLEKYPAIKIITKQNHPGWATNLALATVENTLTRHKNDIAAILANNDGMALGAVQALNEQKLLGKVFVAGADADLAAIKDILAGKQSMTVLKGIKPLAEAAVRVAVALAKKETFKWDTTKNNGVKDVPVVNTPVEKITRENIKEKIVDPGFHSQQAVYGDSKT